MGFSQRLGRACGIVVSAAVCFGLASAQLQADIIYSNGEDSITLQELIDGGSITIQTDLGTAEFKNWGGFNSIAFGGADLVDPNKVDVTGVEDGSKVGVDYQSAEFKALAGQDQDTEWSYEVDLSGGGVTTMDLSMNGFSASDGGIILILENADNGSVDVGDTFVIDSDNQTQSFNWTMFDDPQSWFTVEKDVELDGGDGIASFSGMKQTFEIIPEPASFGLLALGSLVLVRRRRSA